MNLVWGSGTGLHAYQESGGTSPMTADHTQPGRVLDHTPAASYAAWGMVRLER